MAETNRILTTVTFKHPDTQPPVYLAGAFSDPQWQPLEMGYTTHQSNQHEFYREIEVLEGQSYEYKFRLGPGDWWVLDEGTTVVTDNAGNRNNVLHVPIREIESGEAAEEVTEPVHSPSFVPLTEKETSTASEFNNVSELTTTADSKDVTQEIESKDEEPTKNTYLRQLDGTVEGAQGFETSTMVEEDPSEDTQKLPVSEEEHTTSGPAKEIAAQEHVKSVPAQASHTLGNPSPRKESVIDFMNGSLKPKQNQNKLEDPDTSKPGGEDQAVQSMSDDPVSTDTNTLEPVSVGTSQDVVDTTSQSSISTPIEPPRRVKSRSPSPGQLFSKAHLVRLQDKKKTPPIKEDVDSQDYMEDHNEGTKRSEADKDYASSSKTISPFPEPPQTPPRSRRTSSRSRNTSQPPFLSKASERSVSDDLSGSQERVFPSRKQQSYHGSASEDIDEDFVEAGKVPSANTFSNSTSEVASKRFHLDWCPLDWHPEAKEKYDEQHLRLEKIRRPLNHYYDDEKAAHRELLNSQRGQLLHSLYNVRRAKSAAATEVTRDMWTYINHLREEKRIKTSRKPSSVPLTWIFHLDEPQHPQYTAQALEEQIKIIEDEIAFYDHREKAEAGVSGDRPNSWYSPASHEFLDESMHLGSEHDKVSSPVEDSYNHHSTSDNFTTWKQKQAQIVAKKGDIFHEDRNVQLDLLTKLDDAGVRADSPVNMSVSEDEGTPKPRDTPNAYIVENAGSALPEPSNITPLHVGNRQLGNESEGVSVNGDGPQINIHPATPAPPSKDADNDKQLGHDTDGTKEDDSTTQLRASDKRASQLSNRPITPNSMHTVGQDSKHTKNVFHTFLRFIFVEFWKGLFQKVTRFGRGHTTA